MKKPPKDSDADELRRLWDEIAPELEKQPASAEEREFIDERLRDVEGDLRADRRWEDVRRDLRRGK